MYFVLLMQWRAKFNLSFCPLDIWGLFKDLKLFFYIRYIMLGQKLENKIKMTLKHNIYGR